MSIVEKMARAIYASEGKCYAADDRMFQPFPWEELDDDDYQCIREGYRDKARAALTATGLTEAQLEGLANGTMACVPVGRRAKTPRIYIASKTVHGAKWRKLRDGGEPIISTWINEAEQGATSDWPDLWTRCIYEASTCSALVVYREAGEILKGAWAEVGAALAAGKTVFAVGCEDFSIRHHPRFVMQPNLELAMLAAKEG